MENYLTFACAMVTMPEIDIDDVRFGQLLVLLGGLSNRLVRPPCCVSLLTPHNASMSPLVHATSAIKLGNFAFARSA